MENISASAGVSPERGSASKSPPNISGAVGRVGAFCLTGARLVGGSGSDCSTGSEGAAAAAADSAMGRIGTWHGRFAFGLRA